MTVIGGLGSAWFLVVLGCAGGGGASAAATTEEALPEAPAETTGGAQVLATVGYDASGAPLRRQAASTGGYDLRGAPSPSSGPEEP